MKTTYGDLTPGSYIRDVPELQSRERIYLFQNGIGVSVWKRPEHRLTAGYTVGIILNGEIAWCQGGTTLRAAMQSFRRDAVENRGWGHKLDGSFVSYETMKNAYQKLCRRSVGPAP